MVGGRQKTEGPSEGIREVSEVQRDQAKNIYTLLPPEYQKAHSVDDLARMKPNDLYTLVLGTLPKTPIPKEFHDFIAKELTDGKDNRYDALITNLANLFKSLPERREELITAVGALKDALTDLSKEKSPSARKDAEERASLASQFLQAAQGVVDLNGLQSEAGVSDADITRQNRELHDKMDAAYLKIIRETGSEQKAVEGMKVVFISDFAKRQLGAEQQLRNNDASEEEVKKFGVAFSRKIELEANSLVIMDVARRKGDAGALQEASDAQDLRELKQVNSQHNLMSEFAFGALIASTATALTVALSEGAEVKSPGMEAGAAAQFQMDNIMRQKDAQQQLKEMDEMLEELEKKSENDSVEDAELSPELLALLEKSGVEKEDSVKEAIEAVEKIIENVELQNEKVSGLEKGFNEKVWEEEGFPPFHANPKEVFEKNGMMENGELNEIGRGVMPTLMEESVGDFIRASETVILRIDIENHEELVDKLNEARAAIVAYMKNPEDAENAARFNNVMADPEIVAVKSAFFEALAENAGEVISNRPREEVA